MLDLIFYGDLFVVDNLVSLQLIYYRSSSVSMVKMLVLRSRLSSFSMGSCIIQQQALIFPVRKPFTLVASVKPILPMLIVADIVILASRTVDFGNGKRVANSVVLVVDVDTTVSLPFPQLSLFFIILPHTIVLTFIIAVGHDTKVNLAVVLEALLQVAAVLIFLNAVNILFLLNNNCCYGSGWQRAGDGGGEEKHHSL